MSLKTKMTAIADKIRTLLGITDAMGLDAMANNIQTAQNEVEDQASLIAQLQNVLAIKSAGIVPSGDFVIDANGIYDVTQYANALVKVPFTTVETRRGQFIKEYMSGDLNVEIGFVPDVVQIIPTGYEDRDDGSGSVFFYRDTIGSLRLNTADVDFEIRLIPDGFCVSTMGTHGSVTAFDHPFYYIAVKFT